VGQHIRTGSLGIDIALGGGWCPGTLNEVWGDPGSAKTTLVKHTAKALVRARGSALWLDLDGGGEHMDNAPGVIVCRPRNAEEAFFLAEEACREPAIQLVIFDPTQHLARAAELAGDPSFVPHPQREYAKELTALKQAAKASGTVVLFAGQPRNMEREPIRGTGISEKVHYRVHLHPDVVHQDHSREIQWTIKKVLAGERTDSQVRFHVHPGTGIIQAREIAELGVLHGLVIQRGPWYAWNNLQAQGIDEFARLLARQGQAHMLETDIRVVANVQ
jgi:recombination protein RecA